ncbi:MAG: lamin tail domain-containing protein [Candidatus Wildermuthbacteria bacterium]|nr:lamin tail domain-containing protein [Candidatus Wildermuthbacteria bacterium]
MNSLVTLHVLKKHQVYDGLWRYFEHRRTGNSHQESWEAAYYEMAGFAKFADEKYFAALWEKWGPYTDYNGVTEEAKRKFKEEMQELALEASAAYAENLQQKQPSLFAKVKQAVGSFANKVGKTIAQLGKTISSFVSRGGAGVSLIEETDTAQAQASFQEPEPTQALEPIQKSIQQEPAPTPAPAPTRVRTPPPAEPPKPQPIQPKLIQPEPIQTEPVQARVPESQENAVAQRCIINPAASPKQDAVIFNEIAWMGNADSPNKEWIELQNLSGQAINLAGWQIQDKKEDIKILFEKEHELAAQGLMLLERTSDETVPGVKAHVVYQGALNNSNEVLYLFDGACALQDMVVADPSWPRGDNESKRTMERTQYLSWQTSESGGGTPRLANSRGYDPAVSFGGGGNISFPQSYGKILISEVQIEGQTPKDEFIELYNPSGENIDLTGWKLAKKTASGNESNLVSSSAFAGIIQAGGYFLIVPQADDDGTPNYKGQATPDLYYSGKTYSFAEDNTILFYNPLGEISDKVGFGAAQDFEGGAAPNHGAGKTLGRKQGSEYQDTDNNSQDFEEQNPSPKAVNQADLPAEAPSEGHSTELSLFFQDQFRPMAFILLNARMTPLLQKLPTLPAVLAMGFQIRVAESFLCMTAPATQLMKPFACQTAHGPREQQALSMHRWKESARQHREPKNQIGRRTISSLTTGKLQTPSRLSMALLARSIALQKQKRNSPICA